MWTADTKGSRLLSGVESNGRITEQTRLETLSKEDGKNIFTCTVYIEASNSVVGTVVLVVQPVLNTLTGSGGSDSIKMTIIEIDLDIDSDNSSLGSAAGRTALEEFLEDHDYAPGKVIVPNFGDFDNDGILDCWDGYKVFGYETQWANAASQTFIQIVVSVPAIAIEGFELQFTYKEHIPMARLTGGSQTIAGGDGHIRIWRKDGNLARTVADYVASGISYTLTQLGWVPGQTSITLYVEGIAENIQTTRQLAESNGKPSTSIIVNYFLSNGGASLNVGSDEVFYVVAKEKSFYYELLTHQELVATYASKLIYERENIPSFALKIQDVAELTKLGLLNVDVMVTGILNPVKIIDLLSTPDDFWGLNAALYREYLTGKYVLTFAGTDFTSFDDWRTNFLQAFGTSDGTQYELATKIANKLVNNIDFNFNSSNTYIAGHSLGGGLASAASIISGFHAYTFNAAGLHPNTVFGNAQNLANANLLVTSYKVDYDILSWGQYGTGWIDYIFGTTAIPPAIGYSITIDGEDDIYMALNLTSFITSWLSGNYLMTSLNGSLIVLNGIECHKMSQVYYGMEQRIFS
jgi:hypothetical protein